MAAPDIGNFGATLQLVDDAVEGREPIAHQIVMVTRAEKACDGAEEAARVLAPRYAATDSEYSLDLILALNHPRHQVKCPHHVDGAVLYRKHHSLLGRQGEFLRRRVV